jgi:dihydropyrimidine dehydrogenase (NAD+) subunit PreT
VLTDNPQSAAPADALSELLPPLTPNEAAVEAARCLMCYDAPCTHACPTHIDIPRFIKKISTDNLRGSARTILESNLLGATCARVCPVQHDVALFERRDLAGGLSTYGIIGLREPVTVALAEVAMVQKLGVKIESGRELGANLSLADLSENFEAIFLGVGLGATPALGIPGEDHIVDGLQYIEQSKLDAPNLVVGHRVVVVGAGNTAIDCATIAKRLGANQVTMVYRRSEKEMTAYPHEYDFIKREGVGFLFLTLPVRVHSENGTVKSLQCLRMSLGPKDASGRPSPEPIAGSEFFLPADQVVKAIGQHKPSLASQLKLKTKDGFIEVNADFETSLRRVFAGGDCIRARGAASTVMAVQDGKLAARRIHERLVARG